MNTGVFESHNLSNLKVPFIFHNNLVIHSNFKYAVPNWHNNAEILFFTEGEGSVLCGNELHPVSEDDIFIVNSNTLHDIISDGTVKYHCLIIDNDFCRENGIDCTKTEFLNYAGNDESRRIFRKIVDEIESDDIYKEAGIRSAVLELMVYLVRNYSRPLVREISSGKNMTENIQLAIGYIRTHIEKKLTVDEIADEVGLSKYHFSREFKKATGLTIISYINIIRCRNAKKLLMKNEYSVHDIAVKCGFENDSYFSKTFKKHMGVLPSEYLRGEL